MHLSAFTRSQNFLPVSATWRHLAFVAALVPGAGLPGSLARGEITNHESLPPPAQIQPAVSVSYTDPRFQSRITRLTSARDRGNAGLVPDYAKRQAWNADESRLLLRSTESGLLLVNGTTLQIEKTLEDIAGDDVFWHPRNPALLYYNPGNALMSCNVITGERQTLHTFTGYEFADTRGEGNLSLDGRYYAVVARTYNERTGATTYRELQLLDVAADKIIGRHALPPVLENFDWVSVSPSGKYVVVDYADTLTGRHHGVEVYDASFNLVWQKPLGAGHSDLAIDVDGEDVLVIDLYDAASNQTIFKKYHLATGRETTLLALSPLFDQHISCRNTALPGWCLISTFDFIERLTHTEANWLPFEDEIFFLKLDGSGQVRRLAHHRSRRYSPTTPDSDRSQYFAEPHATVNRQGDKILFGSNWSQAIARPESIDTYLIQLDPGRLANLSVRSSAGSGADTLTVGFNLAGSDAAPLLIRGVGPALGAFGVSGALADPSLRLMSANGATVAQNDNWDVATAAAAASVGAFALPPASKDAALWQMLPPGAYTAQIGGGNGTALVEVYSSGNNPAIALTNLSARARVGADGETLIAGFVIAGRSAKMLLIRGVGPALTQFGVSGALADPQLQLFQGTTLAAENTGWSRSSGIATEQILAAAFARAGAFAFSPGSRDTALLVTLEPGAYTAQVRGGSAASGVALVEIYEL